MGSIDRPTTNLEALLVTGTRVRLTLPGLGTDVDATIADRHVGHALALRVLADAEVVASLGEGQPVQVTLSRDGDATYRFATTVRTIRPTAIPLVLSWPSSVARVQARSHVRLPLATDAWVALAGPRPAGHPILPDGWLAATVVDVSAGGVALVTTEPLPEGMTALVRYELAARHGQLVVAARARIVRSELSPARDGSRADRWRLALSLIDVDTRTEEAMVRAVFHGLTQRAGR